MRRRTIVLLALFAAYASFFLCRANVDAALPLLSRAYGYDKEQLGRLSSLSILAYAAGKVTLGPLGDVVRGGRLIFIAIAGSVAASFAFGFSSSLVLFTSFAAANRWFQSGGWAGVVHVSSREFASEEHGSVMGSISTSYEIGSVVSLLLCGMLVRSGLSWRALFVVNPLLFAAIGLTTTHVLRRATAPSGGGRVDRLVASVPNGANEDEGVFRRLAWLAGLRPFWIAVSLSFLLTFVRTGFLTWTPTFLAEVTAKDGGSVSGAILKSAVFPATGIAGALLAGRASDRFGAGRRAPVIAVSLAFAVVSVLVLSYVSAGHTAWVVASIAASGFFVLGPYSLVGGAVALDVGATRAASTATGLIDAAGYVGGSLAGVLLGTLAERHGWSSAFDAIAAVAFAAAIIAAIWGFASGAPVPSKEAL